MGTRFPTKSFGYGEFWDRRGISSEMPFDKAASKRLFALLTRSRRRPVLNGAMQLNPNIQTLNARTAVLLGGKHPPSYLRPPIQSGRKGGRDVSESPPVLREASETRSFLRHTTGGACGPDPFS